MSAYSVRELAAGELAAAALMEAELFSDAWTEVSLQELLANPCNHAYELRIGEDAAAYCLTCEILDEGEILRIGTLRKYQNGGAGSFLAAGYSAAESRDYLLESGSAGKQPGSSRAIPEMPL